MHAVYTGNFIEGKRHGLGKMVYTDKNHCLEFLGETEGEYLGQWKDDQRHGQGTMLWPSGIRYEGRFAQDRRHHVTGKLFFQNGNVYEGGFVINKLSIRVQAIFYVVGLDWNETQIVSQLGHIGTVEIRDFCREHLGLLLNVILINKRRERGFLMFFGCYHDFLISLRAVE